MDNETIAQFYAGKKVFITGGTGFLGKVIIWKLLHSCPLIDTIFILLRPKYGRNVQSRKTELFNCPIFDDLKKRNNNRIMEKIVILAGDILLPELGLSEADKERLINEVSVIFYGAAFLKMDAPLKTAIDVNILGLDRTVVLAHKMRKLETFVYISTAYCCCDTSDVEEKLYPIKLNPDNIIKLVSCFPNNVLDKITPDLIHPLPNTYIFSKRLCELLLAKYEGEIPLVIARPTIIISSDKEPLPGWIDNMNGPTGICVAAGRGILRVMRGNESRNADIIPVDIVSNALIGIPWKEARTNDIWSQIRVYNIASSECKRLTWKDYMNYAGSAHWKYPFSYCIWYPEYFAMEKNKYLYHIKTLLYHDIPFILIDALMLLFRQKRFMRKVQKKISQASGVLAYFTLREWNFRVDNLHSLWQIMTPEDKEIFPLVNDNIEYDSYSETAALGIKKYILKEDLSNIRYCRMFLKVMYVVKILTAATLMYIVLKMFRRITTHVFPTLKSL